MTTGIYLQVLEANYPAVLAKRYLTAGGCTLLMYDHLITFGKEVRLVWSQPLDMGKILFLIMRYYALGHLIMVAHMTSGLASHSDRFCQNWIVTVTGSFMVSTAVSNFILIMRFYTLYDHRPRTIRILRYSFGLSYLVSTVFGIVVMAELFNITAWEPYVNRECTTFKAPRYFVGFWAPQVLSEVFMFALSAINSVSRPIHTSSEVVRRFNRDGFIYILVLFTVRAVNLILSGSKDPEYNMTVLYLAWAITMMTLSRMLLRVEDMRLRATQSLIVDGKAVKLDKIGIRVDQETVLAVR